MPNLRWLRAQNLLHQTSRQRLAVRETVCAVRWPFRAYLGPFRVITEVCIGSSAGRMQAGHPRSASNITRLEAANQLSAPFRSFETMRSNGGLWRNLLAP